MSSHTHTTNVTVPKVAIVTRTKDREITLRRTARSVMDQTYPDILWVLVNDGGSSAHVDRLADEVRESGREVLVVHHEKSQGRPAAANVGIAANSCPWLLLLDDDDTIAPSFVERCISYLEHPEFPCEGVVVWSDIIHERIESDEIVTLARKSGYYPQEVSFFSLFYTNPFPPAAFLFSRKGWEEAGHFDERLHCAEDWNFNQRFLISGRIGIIPEVLAFLHHRVEDHYRDSSYGNTVVHGVDKHLMYITFWRDELLRREVKDGMLGLGELNLHSLNYFYSWQSHQMLQAMLPDLRLFGRVLRALLVPVRFVYNVLRKVKRGLRKFKSVLVFAKSKTDPVENAISKQGGNFFCPICGEVFDSFVPLHEKYIQYTEASGKFTCKNLEMLAVETHHCPKCWSADRDRLSALYLKKELEKRYDSIINVMEFAPCPAVSVFLKSFPNVRLSTCDLYMEGVDYKNDITDMKEIPDESYQMIVCSHVLEHVHEDLQAMREMKRILAQGGIALVTVPIYMPLNDCYENPAITDPSERIKHFGQDDHVRLYSRNGFISRLTEAGFSVMLLGIADFGSDVFKRLGLTETSTLYIAHKPQ